MLRTMEVDDMPSSSTPIELFHVSCCRNALYSKSCRHTTTAPH